MKRISLLIAITFSISNLSFSQILFNTSNSLKSNTNKGYKITGEINGIQDNDTIILAYYFGGKQYAQDTAYIVGSKLTFVGEKELDGGIYLIIMPGGKYFELIISEQEFSFTTNNNDLIGSMRFNNSRENTAFYEYLNFINAQQKDVTPLKDKLNSAKKEEKESIQKEIDEIDKKVRDYRNDFKKRNPDVFFTKIINATTDINIPGTPLDSLGNPKENFQFYYYKKHFWDNFDFSDERMLRTPIFFNKMDQFLEKLTPKHPDSVKISADLLIENAKSNQEFFQYVVSYITSKYERSKIMGMDAVFVHMVENYYINGMCYWVKEKQLEKIIDRAKRISPNMIGKKPPNLVFKDTSDQYHSLYHLQAKYTLLFFYDPDCGHCKKEVPKIKAVCDSLAKAGIDMKVFAVTTEFDIEKWKDFIKEFDTGNWINVGDIQFDDEGNPAATSNWREQYDIHSTPVIYLLDEEKKIIAKRINEKQIVKIIKQKETN